MKKDVCSEETPLALTAPNDTEGHRGTSRAKVLAQKLIGLKLDREINCQPLSFLDVAEFCIAECDVPRGANAPGNTDNASGVSSEPSLSEPHSTAARRDAK